MKSIKNLIFVGLILGCCNVFAGTMGPVEVASPYSPWSVIVSGGYGGYYTGGDVGIGRLALNREMAHSDRHALGLEVGVQQTWDQHRVFSHTIPVTVYPMVDFLFTGKFGLMHCHKLFVQAKAGTILRNWKVDYDFAPVIFDNNTRRTVTDLAFEGQAGLGYAFSERVNLSVSYQGIARANWFGGRRATITQQLPHLNAVLAGIQIAI